MEKRFWVYILADEPYGTLYVGITNDLVRRSWEHREGLYKGHSKKYGIKQLVYYEEYPTAMDAITREKKLKKWRRDWKKQLINDFNPRWQDLYEQLS